jgi:hypothetical protein
MIIITVAFCAGKSVQLSSNDAITGIMELSCTTMLHMLLGNCISSWLTYPYVESRLGDVRYEYKIIIVGLKRLVTTIIKQDRRVDISRGET